MGGNATFSGTNYQSAVIALVYVHVLAQQRLAWLTPSDDLPLAVSGETGGPGDDVRVEFGDRRAPIEIQAKHGLTAGAEFLAFLDSIAARSQPGDDSPIILALNRDSSKKLHTEIARDLDRLRSGRQDELNESVANLLESRHDLLPVLVRLRIVALDLDVESDPEHKQAISLLSTAIESREHATTAWSTLMADAGNVCARRLRRTRADLVELLRMNQVVVRHAPKDDRWHRELDYVKQLIAGFHYDAATAQLARLEIELQSTTVDSLVPYRLNQQYSVVLYRLEKFQESLEYAEKALTYNPKGIPALVSASYACTMLDQFAPAKAYASRAIDEDRYDATGWSALLHSSLATGTDRPSPPASVASSESYKRSVLFAEVQVANWDLAFRLGNELLAGGDRHPETLHALILALLLGEFDAEFVDRTAQYRRVIALASQLIELTAAGTHQLKVTAYVHRSQGYRLLNRLAQADADLRTAEKLDRENLDAIGHRARMLIEAGDLVGAETLLAVAAIDDSASLLSMRARLAVLRRNEIGARADLYRAVDLLPNSVQQDEIRFVLADVAIEIDEIELSERLLSDISESAKELPHEPALRARIAFIRNDEETGFELFKKAVDMPSDFRLQYLREFCDFAIRREQAKKASEYLSTMIPELIDPSVGPVAGEILLQSGSLEAANNLVEAVQNSGQFPDWVQGLATNIALRQEHYPSAISRLLTLVERGTATVEAHVELIRQLWDEARYDEAESHMTNLLRREPFTAVERLQLAQLLKYCGRDASAIDYAFKAFREQPQDPRFHRALIVVTMTSSVEPTEESIVRANTFVKLRAEDGTVATYFVYDDPPADPLRGEITVETATQMSLMGLRVGDSFDLRGRGRAFTVTSIESAVWAAARDAAEKYEERFPAEPFFLTSIKIGDLSQPRDLAPLISTLIRRKDYAKSVFEAYRESGLPLGVVADMLGTSIPEVMRAISADPLELGPLFVEFRSNSDIASYRTLSRSSQLVLTRSALHTMDSLAIMELIGETFTIIVPQSLVRELRGELREAHKALANGVSAMQAGDGGLQFSKTPAGHPTLQARVDSIERSLAFIDSKGTVTPRPLASIRDIAADVEEARKQVGSSSMDAIHCAKHMQATILADDLGLRRLGAGLDESTHSCCTASVLHSLNDLGQLSSSDRNALLLKLILSAHETIAPSSSLLYMAFDQLGTITHSELSRVMRLLCTLAPKDVVRLVGEMLREHATRNISKTPIEFLVSEVMNALAERWPVSLIRQLVLRAAESRLALLPTELDKVRKSSATFQIAG